MDDLTQRIANLSPAKRQLLELRLRRQGLTLPTPTAIPRRPRPGPGPLSFAQQRLWFLHQLEPDQPVYNEPKVFRLRGPLDRAALQQAVARVIERHEVLRTVYLYQDGQPLQQPLAEWRFDLPLVDLQSEPDPSAALAAGLNDAIRRPFDLARDLSMRGVLYALAPQEHVLLLVNHHIATDGWSLSRLWREVGALYAAYQQGRPDPLPPLPLQYADYALWQREQLSGPRLQQALAYWQAHLKNLPPLHLPLFRPRPAAPSYTLRRLDFRVDLAVSQATRALSRQEDATVFMTLLAAYAVLLHRYSGQADFGIGTVIAHRPHPDLEDLLGFFINTLVMRVDLAGQPTFREAVRRVRQVALAAFEHQDLPFEKLVEELSVDRATGRHPLFQTLFSMRNVPHRDLDLAGLEVEPLPWTSGAAKFDLRLTLADREPELVGQFDYDQDVLDSSVMARMVGHFQTLLAAATRAPDTPIHALPWLTDAEQRQLRVDWNATAVPYPATQTLPDLFEAQVGRAPHATALVADGATLSYVELNTRANRLAHLLQAQGVGPESLVGVCLPRSPDLLVALLAVLKAGGAYLPLSPTDPPDRLAFMLDDTRVRLVISHSALAARLPGDPLRVLALDRLAPTLAAYPPTDPAHQATPDSLAYVMYTSGSTGQPKGTAVGHRSVVRLFFGQDYADFGPERTWLQLAPVTFDASSLEIWGALLHGGRLVLAPDGPPDFGQLEQLLHRHAVDTLWLTSSLFNEVVESRPEALRGVRRLLVGGEALSVRHIRLALEHLPDTALVNGYGPTETTTFACCYPIPPDLPPGTASVPIGRPIGNTTAYVLDAAGELVPVGVPGELVIGGVGVAWGYVNRPALTAERFVPDPFEDGGQADAPPAPADYPRASPRPPSRLYRSGDRVRWREDGTLEFLGRLDEQVKIRGFRVEPGEVEAALRELAAVRDCAVVAGEAGDSRRLVAYVVPTEGASLTTETVQAQLRRTLPDYMLPALVVPLDHLPVTASGKLDRHALPAPAYTPPLGLVNARDSLEASLAQLWQAVLGVPRVGIHDNFFALGGHSLLAVQLMDRVHRLTGRRLPIASIFAAPTIAAQADLLRGQGAGPTWRSLIPIQPRGTRPPLFLVPPAAGTTLRFAGLVERLGSDQPIYGFEPLGLDGVTAPQDTVEAMADHYLQEMQSLWPHGPYWLGGVCFGAVVAFEMAQRLVAAGFDAPLLAVFDATPPASGPTWTYERRTPARLMRRILHHARRGTLRWAMQGFWEDERRPQELRKKGRPEWAIQTHQAHVRANRRYVARPYAGRMVLFMSEQFERYGHQAMWASLCGSLERHVFPRTTHQELLRGEFMPVLAARLAEVLAAQATHPHDPRGR